VASELNPATPPGFDAWFTKACAREPAQRFQTANEMREGLERVCGLLSSRASMASIDMEVQYMLKPATLDAIPVDDFEVPNAMSPRTAMLAGLLLGVTVMIGVLGAIAWKVHTADAESTAPSALGAASGSAAATVAAPDAHP
jgi:hypothetical protein